MSRGLAPSFANDEASRAEHKPRHEFVAHGDFHPQAVEHARHIWKAPPYHGAHPKRSSSARERDIGAARSQEHSPTDRQSRPPYDR